MQRTYAARPPVGFNSPVWAISMILGTLLAAFFIFMSPAAAQNGDADLKQIKLNDGHVTGYIKIAPKLAKLFDRIDKAAEKPDKALKGDLEALASEGGFSSFDELELAVSNITFVMSGIDDTDGSFREPVERLQQELEDTKADKDLKAEEKKQLVKSIEESIAQTPKLEHAENVALVQKHFKKLSSLFQD